MTRIAFIGGGNMARSLIGGLLKTGVAASSITVAEPRAEARQELGRPEIHFHDLAWRFEVDGSRDELACTQLFLWVIDVAFDNSRVQIRVENLADLVDGRRD